MDGDSLMDDDSLMDGDSLVWIDFCIIKHPQLTHLQHVSGCECYWMVHATLSLHCLGTPVFLEEDMAK